MKEGVDGRLYVPLTPRAGKGAGVRDDCAAPRRAIVCCVRILGVLRRSR